MSENAQRLTALDPRTQTSIRAADRSGLHAAIGRFGAAHRRAMMTALGLALFVLAWELGALYVHDPITLPSPVDTISTWVYYMHHTYPTVGFTLWMHALFSVERILLGFGFGTLIGVLIGAAMIAVRPVRNVLDPLIELTRPLPPLAFIPIFIVWFGIGDLPKVVLIMIGVVPVMVVSTISALDQVPEEMISAARCLGATSLYAMIHVRIRAAIPSIITGMRIAMGGSWTSIVAAEMIVATNGLGYVILQAGLYLDTKLIFSGILSIAILGISFDALLRWIQRRLDPSGRASRG